MAITERSKPQYQQWREEDFSGDVVVQRMTPTQRWMYRTLLQKAFVYTTRPYLPADDAILWMLADCESEAQWAENKARVLAMFYEVEQDGQRLLAQKRLLDDWEALQSSRQVRIERSRRGGQVAQARLHQRAAAPEYNGGQKGVLDAIRAAIRQAGREPEPKLLPTQEKRLDELVRIKGADSVVAAFYAWLEAQVLEPKEDPYPIGAFLKESQTYMALSEVSESLVGQPDDGTGHSGAALDQLIVDLTALGEGRVLFAADRHRGKIAVMLRDFTAGEILAEFSKFYSGVEDKEMKWAAQTFCDNGAALLAAQRKLVAVHEANVRKMDSIVAQMQQTAEQEFPTPAPATVERSPEDDAFFEIEVTK